MHTRQVSSGGQKCIWFGLIHFLHHDEAYEVVQRPETNCSFGLFTNNPVLFTFTQGLEITAGFILCD